MPDSEPHSLSSRAGWRWWVVLPAAIGGVAVAFFVRGMLAESEHRLVAEQFRGDAKALVGSIEREIAIGVESVQALRAFFSGFDEVYKTEFLDYTMLVLRALLEFEAFQWSPLRDGATYVATNVSRATPQVLSPGLVVVAAIALAVSE